jgi:hypothetical protein
MKREFYVYNEKKLIFEPYKESIKSRILRVFGYVCAVLVTGLIIGDALHKWFPFPEEIALENELDQVKFKYAALTDQYTTMTKVLENIKERNASINELIFGIESIDETMWEAGVGGHEKYKELLELEHSGEIVTGTQMASDQLERRMVLLSMSLDTLTALAKDRETMLASIPSIKPVQEDKLKRRINYLSGYGMRLDPIHKVQRFHKGIDFTAPEGTPIQATGLGKVIRVSNKRTGYGKNVIIDHGYGYKTLYAHLKEIHVKMGEEVKRGQKIGVVGNTGKSTAPHCHYEVRYHDKPINPINFVMDGLSTEEYQELVKMASEHNQSFD